MPARCPSDFLIKNTNIKRLYFSFVKKLRMTHTSMETLVVPSPYSQRGGQQREIQMKEMLWRFDSTVLLLKKRCGDKGVRSRLVNSEAFGSNRSSFLSLWLAGEPELRPSPIPVTGVRRQSQLKRKSAG